MSDLVKRPYDEEFDTQHDVVENPFGAWQAIQSQAARIAELEAKLGKAVEMLNGADRDYNRKTNDLIVRHADRIEELSNSVAVLEVKLAKVIAAYRIEMMLLRRPWTSHEDFDRHIAELTGDKK